MGWSQDSCGCPLSVMTRGDLAVIFVMESAGLSLDPPRNTRLNRF